MVLMLLQVEQEESSDSYRLRYPNCFSNSCLLESVLPIEMYYYA